MSRSLRVKLRNAAFAVAVRVPGLVWLKRKLFGRRDPTISVPLSWPGDRGQPPSAARSLMRDQGPLAEDGFVLYRVIGNDLYPRHRMGQSRANLEFILANEPPLEGCEKRFVLNRIVDTDEEAAIIDLLRRYDMPYVHIPYCDNDYPWNEWDLEGVPSQYFPHAQGFQELGENWQARVLNRLYRYKNNYLINNNGARNRALADGRDRAAWILPWDGNCFLTEQAWASIRESVLGSPAVPYWLVPMSRVVDNQRLLDPDFRPDAREEPQVIFRQDAALRFDEAYFYGRRPKVELFWRLGVPGPWDHWPIEPWDLPLPDYAPQAGQFDWAGWVARLNSGQPRQEVGRWAGHRRNRMRASAVTDFLSRLDCEVLARKLPPWQQPIFFPRAGSDAALGELDAVLSSGAAGGDSLALLATAARGAARLAWPIKREGLRRRLFPEYVPLLCGVLDGLRPRFPELPPREQVRVKRSLVKQLAWLLDGSPKYTGAWAVGPAGAAHELAVFSLASFLDDRPGMMASLRRMRERLIRRLEGDGEPAEGLERVLWALLRTGTHSVGDELGQFQYQGRNALAGLRGGDRAVNEAQDLLLPESWLEGLDLE